MQQLDVGANGIKHTTVIATPSKVKTICMLLMLIAVVTVILFGFSLPTTQNNINFPGCAIEFTNIDDITEQTLARMHHKIRSKVAESFIADNGILFLAGADIDYRYDTDVEISFRQESNFYYLTGYNRANASVVYDLQRKESYLFIPKRPAQYAIWNGKPENPTQIQKQYGFDGVIYHDKFDEFLESISKGDPNFVVYTVKEDSFRISNKYSKNTDKLLKALYASRAVKVEEEIQLLWLACNISNAGHVAVMEQTQVGDFEFTVEGRFYAQSFSCGARHQAYVPIIASGNSSAILHYNVNDQQTKDGQLLLIDAGAEIFGYGADITRTFPVNGKFSKDQKEVYDMVYKVQQDVYSVAKANNPFELLDSTCSRSLCEQLYEHGFITASLDDCLANKIHLLFQPYAVSHYIGLDVHDRYEPPIPVIQPGNVFTVEPGIYFNNAALEPALSDPEVAKYLVTSKIQRLLDEEFGGIRIEDCIAIHETGFHIISNQSPNTVATIEHLMSKNSNTWFY